MKICPKCGAVLKDSYRFCMDCEAELGDALSPEDEAAYQKKMEASIHDLSERTGGFRVGKMHVVNACLQGFGILCFLTLPSIFEAMQTGLGLNFYRVGLSSSWAFWFFTLGLLIALAPQKIWQFTKFHLRRIMQGPEDVQPADDYVWGLKARMWVLFALGFLCLFGWQHSFFGPLLWILAIWVFIGLI